MNKAVTWDQVRQGIMEDGERLGFTASSATQTGQFISALAASKGSARILELGTGLGLGTSWLLQGMHRSATLLTIESDAALSAQAASRLGFDTRVEFRVADGGSFLENAAPDESFDLIFADTWPGKFTHLDAALGMINPNGFYVADDLLPQPGWPQGHGPKVDEYRRNIVTVPGFSWVLLDWDSGLVVGVRTA